MEEKIKRTQVELFKRKLSGKAKKKTAIMDRIKILKYKNRLEKLRLQNQLGRYKLMRRVELLRRKGKLPQAPIPKVRIVRPFFASPHINQDLHSAFNADMGHGDNLFGTEQFYYDNDYYGEDWWGEEMMKDQVKELGLDFKRRGSPLLY